MLQVGVGRTSMNHLESRCPLVGEQIEILPMRHEAGDGVRFVRHPLPRSFWPLGYVFGRNVEGDLGSNSVYDHREEIWRSGNLDDDWKILGAHRYSCGGSIPQPLDVLRSLFPHHVAIDSAEEIALG